MEFDFKVTTWERVEVSPENEEAVFQAIKDGRITTSNDIYQFLDDEGLSDNPSYSVIAECEEQMTVEENGGCATIEVKQGTEYIWRNAE